MTGLRPALLLLATAILASAAGAQTVPFGKNKIQYRDFQWRVLAGEHVDIFYYPEEEELARLTLVYAEESFQYLERKFQHHPFRRIPLIVYASHNHFEQTNLYPGFIPEGVLGFTEYLKRRVALPFRGDYAQFRRTLRHELVHAFQLSKIEEVRALHPGRRRFTPQDIHWWTEGLAEFWSGEQTPEDEMFNRDLVLNGRIPSLRAFTNQRGYASYPLGADLHRFLARRFGEEYIVRVYEEFWKYASFEETLEAVLGQDLDQIGGDWKQDLQRRVFPILGERPTAEAAAVPVIYKGGGNVKPTLHLGRKDSVPELYFLSPRAGYMNIYRTPLYDGEPKVETVVEGERTAEFESFHAFESRIDVHENGLLAFVSRYLERDALFIWDTEHGRPVGRYQWPDLVGLQSPSWDPTGTRIVFEGLSSGGFSDLYIIDFETQQRTALTADRFRDEDPDWSPDGRTIVFASDRTSYGSDGHTNLFLLDLETGDIQYLTSGAWSDRNPRWSRDGRRIAFTSDRTGVFDLYAVDPHGNGRRLTGVAGGAFDPEWLPGDEGLVFTGFSEGAYRIYRFAFGEDTMLYSRVRLAEIPEAPEDIDPVGPAPEPGPMGWKWSELEAPTLRNAAIRPYSSWRGISIDVASGDAAMAPGVGAAQGAQILASDMLGDHVAFAGISALRAHNLKDLARNLSGNFLYLNLNNRLNFGAGLFRVRGQYRDVALDRYEDERYGGFVVASYPFSKFSRIEIQIGLEESDRRDIDEDDGGFLLADDGTSTTNLITRSGAIASNLLSYVKDNTLWIATGPIDGERLNLTAGFATCFGCRLPASPDFDPGDRAALAEHYLFAADYRRYIRTSQFSAYALRAYAFLSDGAIPGRIVLGGPTRLRGYPRSSLAGSRVWLVNQEWRFPILREGAARLPFGLGRSPGLQGAIFVDAGSSWLKDERPSGTWGSYGIGVRSAIGIPFVVRLDLGRRFRKGELPPTDFGTGKEFGDFFMDLHFGYNY